MPTPRPAPPRTQSYRDLEVWQVAKQMTVAIYNISRRFPRDERFGLTAQIRRAAVAVASNVAEGHDRIGPGEFRRFVSIARGSVAEVETQLAIAEALRFVRTDQIIDLRTQLESISKMLFVLHRRLSP